MTLTISSKLAATEFPPIAEALSWVANRKSNRELLNLCQAAPAYPPAAGLQEEIARLAREPSTSGYTPVLGLPALREAFAATVSRQWRARIETQNIAITTGCNQAFAAAVLAIAKAGDNIIIPTPWYFNHGMWLSMMGIAAKAIPAFGKHGPWPDVAVAAKAITAKTRAILLVTPNNPSGAIYPPEVIAAFHALAKKRKIALILDETYADFRPTEAPPHACLQEPNWHNNVIQLHSFSKIYALAGYRLGALVAGPKIIHEVTKILDTITICPPQISQRAVLYALANLDAWKSEKREIMASRLHTLRQAFARPDLQYQLVSSGAYFAWTRHPFGKEKSKPVARRLAEQHDILCLPGSMFGTGQDKFLRLAFGNVEADRLGELAERLVQSQS